MSEKILIASGKGGVGKSTVASFLGNELSSRGKKVLLLDSDAGLGALDILLGVSDRTVFSWLDAFDGNCKSKSCIIPVGENLDLVPSPSVFPEDLGESVFDDIISEFDGEYDIILFDAPAGIDENLRRAARVCDKAIFVATADEISVKCACAAAGKVEEWGIESECERLIINRFVKKAAMKSRLLNIDGVIDKSGVMLLGILPEDKTLPFMSVTAKKPSAKSRFSLAVKRIADRIEGKRVPLALNKL